MSLVNDLGVREWNAVVNGLIKHSLLNDQSVSLDDVKSILNGSEELKGSTEGNDQLSCMHYVSSTN
jgi:hypothetical protein